MKRHVILDFFLVNLNDFLLKEKKTCYRVQREEKKNIFYLYNKII